MGRGSSGAGTAWKKQLRNMAKSGVMPKYIMGSPDQQKQVFEEIDKLYKKPDMSNVYHDKDGKPRITDTGDAYFVTMKGGATRRASFPSGKKASPSEKRGVLKWMLR